MARERDAGSEQPTHEPTARRIADARLAGLVAHSADLRGALALAATGVTVALLAPSIAGQLVAAFAIGLRRASQGESLSVAAARGLDTGARVLAAPLAVAFVVTLVAGLLQTGGLWVPGPRPDRGVASPGAALGRLWSATAFASSLAGLAKAVVVAVVSAVALRAWLPQLARLAGVPAARALAAFGTAAQTLGVRVLVVLVAIGAADYAWVRRRHRRALRMTARDLERERREREGDPLPRAERRRQHGALSATAAPADPARAVRAAALVVAAGSAVAGDACVVALAYERGGPRAPAVVAAARGDMAAILLAAARVSGVPVVGDAALAAALVDLDPGTEIPASAYDAVAEALRAVLGLDAGTAPAPMPHGASRADA